MCVQSVIHDYMRQNTSVNQWTRPMLNEYQEIMRRIADLDAKLDQRHCEDPAKAAWMREVENRLGVLEAI